MSSKDRVRNFESELSSFTPSRTVPWQTGGGGFGAYPGHPGLPQTPLESFNSSNIVKGVTVFGEVDNHCIATMTDRVTPGFHKIVKEGEFRPINPMSKVIVNNQPKAVADITLRQLSVGNATYAEGQVYNRRIVETVPTPVPLASDDDVNAMLLEAKANLKSAGMDYMTSAAEFRETLGMFLNMKQNLLNRRDGAVKAWSKDLAQKRKSGKFRGFNSLKEGWEAFSSFWLEYRFGWRILAYDIEAILDYYKRKDDGILLFTRRVTKEFDDTTKYLIEPPRTLQTSFLEIWGHLEQTERVRVGYSAYIDQSVLGNPILLNTAYDITPWTLVVDMFFNVQNNIIALSTMPIGCSEVSGSGFISREMKSTLTILPKYIPKVGLQLNEVVITPQTVGINKAYSRKAIGEPSFDISFQPNLDLGKIIDLATLALPIFRIIRRFLK